MFHKNLEITPDQAILGEFKEKIMVSLLPVQVGIGRQRILCVGKDLARGLPCRAFQQTGDKREVKICPTARRGPRHTEGPQPFAGSKPKRQMEAL